jgi:hypothetical protein
MSNKEKVALAETTKDDYGLSAVFPQGHRDDVAALELPRSTRYYHQKHVMAYTEKYAHLQEPLEGIARDNPAYGYRRTTKELKEIQRHRINHKVVQRLHQEWGLPLLRSIKPPKPSGIRQLSQQLAIV